jgi:post-segregation antitoxin (ccd killing protein)
MPKVSVYLPDDLYQAARAQGLSISTVTQRALEVAVHANATDRWIDRVRARPRTHLGAIDSATLLDEVRDEFGA